MHSEFHAQIKQFINFPAELSNMNKSCKKQYNTECILPSMTDNHPWKTAHCIKPHSTVRKECSVTFPLLKT